MKNSFFNNNNRYFFVGIGGVSMSALAKYLVYMKKEVCGYDEKINQSCNELIGLGVNITTDKTVDVGNFDVVVYTDAIDNDFIILRQARMLSKIVISRAEFLFEVSKNFEKVIAISGCHGKTTVTALLSNVFYCANKNFCCHIGAIDNKFSNFAFFGNEFLITEACEYKKNFLHLFPDLAVVLNTDFDHVDCYKNESELISAYSDFLSQSKEKIVGSNKKIFNECITFGLGKNNNYYARNLQNVGGKYSFDVVEDGTILCKINSALYGKHNVLNALAVVAASRRFNISVKAIKNGIENFCGIGRRFEDLGVINGAKCIADYAHHPSEIRAVLKVVKDVYHKKLFVIFQPHTYSRTRALMTEFVSSLSQVKNLIIFKTFAAREYYDDAGSALTLHKRLKKSRYVGSGNELKDALKEVNKDDLVVVLGAGDVYDVVKSIIKN